MGRGEALVEAAAFSHKWNTGVVVFWMPSVGEALFYFVEQRIFPVVRKEGLTKDDCVIAIFDRGNLIDDRSAGA